MELNEIDKYRTQPTERQVTIPVLHLSWERYASFKNEMKKRFEKYIFKTDNETFLIEEDLPEVGWYLYRIDRNGKTTHDYLQESKDNAMNFALDQFQIPINSWSIET